MTLKTCVILSIQQHSNGSSIHRFTPKHALLDSTTRLRWLCSWDTQCPLQPHHLPRVDPASAFIDRLLHPRRSWLIVVLDTAKRNEEDGTNASDTPASREVTAARATHPGDAGVIMMVSGNKERTAAAQYPLRASFPCEQEQELARKTKSIIL